MVITDEAFVRGQASQQLTFNIDYDHKRVSIGEGSFSLQQQAVISPAVIRLAIEIGSKKTNSFTGEVGKNNVVLEGDDVVKLQDTAFTDLPSDE